jgi:hydrogenase maturation protein HypF
LARDCENFDVTVVTVRKAIEIAGIVQGVGFRPYIYRLATEYHLTGFITNTEAGVSIEVEGSAEGVETFLSRLPKELPPLARITHIAVTDRPSNHDTEFRILPSRVGEERRVLISPDVAICGDCLRELLDPADRRFRYPFINCTNCGPRYTIVRDIPYDRAKTSMAVFPMCPDCRREYDDPRDRRFHAQPNACWKCGPHVELWDARGQRIESADPIARTVELLAAGEIVAVKGLGGFHLAADAFNESAVARLRERKRRVEKPFAIMAANLECLEELCVLDDVSRAVLQSPAHPIVLAPKKHSAAQPQPENKFTTESTEGHREGSFVSSVLSVVNVSNRKTPSPHGKETVAGATARLASAVAPFNRDLGVFLPYTPLHHLLFAGKQLRALVMTSGNIAEEPIAIGNGEAVERLGGLADYFLVHNREILLRSDDSVVRVAGGRVRQIRRSRGYVPAPVFLHQELPAVLAVGGELKNTICLTRGSEAFLSQHIGDLENLESYKFFESTVAGLKSILEVEPRLLAYDLHPGYFSTRWALAQEGMERVGVQHHHAHIASCMAENHLEGSVIGFALDGTGYGTDGNVWGGEVLVAGYQEFQRLAHLDYVAMPGGSAAVVEPRRMAISYLFYHLGRDFWDLDIPFVRGLDRRKTETLLRLIEQGVNSPLTSSAGRLFDAVAAVAGVRETVNYEAQAAIELEAAICGADGRSAPVIHEAGEIEGYPFAIREESGAWIIDTRPMFLALVEDIRKGVPTGIISRRFHLGFADVLAIVAERVRERSKLNRVCLSGGTFQNRFLAEHFQKRLERKAFQVFTHAEVPCGDGGISLGQALIAAHHKAAG